MTEHSPVLLAASTVQTVGLVIALTIVVGFVVYAAFNVRAGRKEVGAELELAANLKPYYDDDELETKKLDRTLTMGLLMLAVVGIGLPAYWLAEPGRQEGAIEEFARVAVSRGAGEYEEACGSCHGPEGVGGLASYTILDDDNEFVAQVQWKAPALDTVMLRYDREEVEFVLNYGRPFSPMPAWGAPGGGPMTDQQVNNIIDYLESITLSSEESKEAVETALRSELGIDAETPINYRSLATGEALFNLGRDDSFAGGAYACGRCHTRGWSMDEETAEPANADLGPYVDFEDGAGAYGPNLRGDLIPRQFLTIQALADFLHVGAKEGEPYGNNGLSGDGMMPGFGDNPNTDEADDGMMTAEMVEAIARYVASLGGGERAEVDTSSGSGRQATDAGAGSGNQAENDATGGSDSGATAQGSTGGQD